MSTDQLILDMLHQLDEKVCQLDRKFDEKFGGLKCQDQNIRIDRLEQKELDRKDHKKTLWAVALAAVSAFGLSLWQWIKGA
jgi:hypothetical protein